MNYELDVSTTECKAIYIYIHTHTEYFIRHGVSEKEDIPIAQNKMSLDLFLTQVC